MSTEVSQQISLFLTQIQNRRFGDTSIAILESVLTSKDVKSSLEIRSSLKEFLRREVLFVIREIAEKSVDQKLVIVDFFVRAFALIGDVESCLSLRYEAFVMRDWKASTDVRLRVSLDEWLVFAEQSFDHGFHSVAIKACERALLANNFVDNENGYFRHECTVEKIKRLKDASMILARSQSVQVQASEYLKKKNDVEQLRGQDSIQNDARSSGSTLFRNGIKRRNQRKLQEHRSLQQFICDD